MRGVGTITTVSAERFEPFALIERPDGTEAHAFLSDLTREQLVMPAEAMPYRELTRQIGPSHYGAA